MTALLALFLRSMRMHLRAKSTSIASFVLVALIFVLLIVAHGTALVASAPGLRFFELVMMLNLFAITLVGVSYFASAITEEKEEGTLGLLEMTDLDPLAILLGKSTARLCGALLLLAAQIPFTLLAVSLGGIGLQQIFAAYITLAGYTFLLSNAALLASVAASRTAIASAIMAAAVLLAPSVAAGLRAAPLLAARPVFRGFLDGPAAVLVRWGEGMSAASPFRRLNEIVTTGFQSSVVAGQFWVHILAGLACFAAAWLGFRWFTGDSRLFVSGRLVPRPTSRRLSAFAPRRAWLISAIAWKDYHFLHGGPLVQHAKTIAYGLLCAFVAWRNNTASFATAAGAVYLAMACVLALEMAITGSRILREEVRNQTLVALAGLPFAMKRVALMKLDGARRSLVPAAGWTAAGFLAFIIASIFVSDAGIGAFSLIAGGLGLAYILVQALLLAHVAAWFSLRMKFGALPVSVAACVAGNIVGGSMCFGIVVAPIVALILVPSLREAIYARLEAMAGED